jgi:hypothetical protein
VVQKQPLLARSSTESEFKAIANGTAEPIWIEHLLNELGISTSSPPTLWCDNIGAIYLSANPVFHACTKHVALDYHFVRERVQADQLVVKFISIADQIGDIFTKPLASDRFVFLRNKLRLLSAST